MQQTSQRLIQALIKLESVFTDAGKIALKLRGTSTSTMKYQTGIAAVDIVTEADLTVQEHILTALARTELINCELIAEEKTPSVKQFAGTNGFVLTVDPIDGTFIYTGEGRFFSTIVCLHDRNVPVYSFCHYPAVGWSRRITAEGVQDFGTPPLVQTKKGVDLSRTIAYTYGDPQTQAADIFTLLTSEGYTFRQLKTITDEAGSCTLLFLKQVAGYYVDHPSAYDSLCALHYGRVKKYRTHSNISIAVPQVGTHGYYYPGWYTVLRN